MQTDAREQEVMILMGFETVQDLGVVSERPVTPDFQKRGRVPEEEYELLEKERRDEEEFYELNPNEVLRNLQAMQKFRIKKIDGSLFSGCRF